jgi:hypothetical protein
VTSDLDPGTPKAEDCQGESGRCKQRHRSRKYFVLKILTPKSLGLKILRAAFVNPALGAGFRDGGGEGYPGLAGDSRNGTDANCSLIPFFYVFLSPDLHSPQIHAAKPKRKAALRAASDPTVFLLLNPPC